MVPRHITFGFGVRTSGVVDLQSSDEAITANPALATDVSPEALVLADDDGEAGLG